MDFFPLIKVFSLSTLSFLVAMVWAPILVRFLSRHRLGKRIRDAKEAPVMAGLHAAKEGTPTMGGVLVWGTTLAFALLLPMISSSFSFFSRAETYLPLGALIASALVGLVDDLFNIRRIGAHGGGLRMRHRFFIYTAIAAVGAWWFFIKLERDVLHIPFLGNIDVGWWYIPIFIFIIVATAFSVNEIDGLDGLAGGTLLTAFGAYGAIAFIQGRYDLATFIGVIIGALLAFLWFNINPARFFMGDTGAMSLGVTLGVIAMLTNSALLLPLIGLMFVVESLSVIVQITSRKLFHRKIFRSSPIHHHLEAIGWKEPQIVMRFWMISGVTAVAGLVLFLVDRLLT
ncbi:MAG: phospho-N-acetylmuramoyl-pentapeptide-transferase [bacterium]|nr:phospho-N-acetylmuramoyl-pentapeptide-transferase [bacterium]